MPKRWNRTSTNDPTALARRLPGQLRDMTGFRSIEEIDSRQTAVAEWLDTQVPGQGEELAGSVMTLCGITVAHRYAVRLGTHLPPWPQI